MGSSLPFTSFFSKGQECNGWVKRKDVFEGKVIVVLKLDRSRLLMCLK